MAPRRTTREQEADRHWAIVSSATQQAGDGRRAATWIGLALIRAGSALAGGPVERPPRQNPLSCEA